MNADEKFAVESSEGAGVDKEPEKWKLKGKIKILEMEVRIAELKKRKRESEVKRCKYHENNLTCKECQKLTILSHSPCDFRIQITDEDILLNSIQRERGK